MNLLQQIIPAFSAGAWAALIIDILLFNWYG